MSEIISTTDAIQFVNDYDRMLETVKRRRSTRTFIDTPLRQEDIDKIKAYLETDILLEGPFGRSFRIEFLQTGAMNENAKIGTYGYLKNPQGFLVGMAENNKMTLFEIAYTFEGLVLYLTSEGIGTCWLGGIFNQDDVRASTYVSDDEIVPAITPLGYKSEKKHFMGKVAKFVLKPHKRRPVDEIAWVGNFDHPFTDESHHLYQAIYYGTLAPNAQNKQSWRILVSNEGNKVHFFVKFKLKKQVHDNFRGYACPPEYLDIGIFYKHFETCLKAKGIHGKLSQSEPKVSLPEEGMEYIITWNKIDA